jgi:hypothetical protein
MHIYAEEHTVYGDYAFEKWDPELVADLLDRVNPYNMRLDLVTKNFDKTSSGTTSSCFRYLLSGFFKPMIMFG